MNKIARLPLRRLVRPLGGLLAGWMLALCLLPLALAAAQPARGPQTGGLEHEFCVAGLPMASGLAMVGAGLDGTAQAVDQAAPTGTGSDHDLAGCLLCPQCVGGLAALPTAASPFTLPAAISAALPTPAPAPWVNGIRRGHAQPRAPPAA